MMCQFGEYNMRPDQNILKLVEVESYSLFYSESSFTCDFIKYSTAKAFGIRSCDLDSRTRKQADIAFARQIAMYIAHVRLGLNLGEVGKVFQRDRTTVGHACRLIEDRRDDEQVDFLINCLERAVEEWLQIVHHPAAEIASGEKNERS